MPEIRKEKMRLYRGCLFWLLKNIIKVVKDFKNFIGCKCVNSQYDLGVINIKIKRLDIKEINPFKLLSPEILSKTKIKYYSKKVEGTTFPLELLIICGLVKKNNPDKIFELGTFEGNTAMNIANNSKSGEIYTLSTPVPNLGKYIKNDRIKQIIGDSQKYDFSEFSNKLDFIFIDASHSYTYVKNDTINMLKCLKNNGIILWHDFEESEHRNTMMGILDGILESKTKLKLYTVFGTWLLIGFRE